MRDDPPEPSSQPLETSLRTTWNARVVDYDAARFPFAGRLLDEVRRLGFELDSLERLHEVVPPERTYTLSKELCEATHRPSFRRLLFEFVRDSLAPRTDLVPPIAVQRFLNVRIMLPDKPQAVFPFHTGLLYGHGAAARSVWLPLTDVTREEDRSASLQIIDLERSRELTRHATEHQLSIERMTDLFGAESTGVRAGPGQVLLFTQEHIHGNFVNETGKTRVSIDFRVAERRFGDLLARKIPGGYFELVPEPSATPADTDVSATPGSSPADNGRPNVIYLNNNTRATRDVPPHLQRLMVYDYCEKQGLAYEFELFELETMDHLPTLSHLVDTLACNALLYSIYALPEEAARREALYDAAATSGVLLHFANEGLTLASERDRERIEATLAFAGYGEP